MISNRNDIFRCLIIGSCLFIFWGVIIIWIVSYQNLCHALYLTLYFSKYSGVTIIWNSTRSMPWGVPTNWNMSSNWHQRVQYFWKKSRTLRLNIYNPLVDWLKDSCHLSNARQMCRFYFIANYTVRPRDMVYTLWNGTANISLRNGLSK